MKESTRNHPVSAEWFFFACAMAKPLVLRSLSRSPLHLDRGGVPPQDRNRLKRMIDLPKQELSESMLGVGRS